MNNQILKDILKQYINEIIEEFSNFDKELVDESLNNTLLNDIYKEDGTLRANPQWGSKEIALLTSEGYKKEYIKNIEIKEKYIDNNGQIQERIVKPFINVWSEFAEILKDKLKNKLKILLEKYSEKLSESIEEYITSSNLIIKSSDHYLTDYVYLLELLSKIFGTGPNINFINLETVDDIPLPNIGNVRLFIDQNNQLCLKLANGTIKKVISSSFIELPDTPNTYEGYAGYSLRVKDDESGLEFYLPQHTDGKVKVGNSDEPGYLKDKLISSDIINVINLGNALKLNIVNNSLTSEKIAQDVNILSKISNNKFYIDIINDAIFIDTARLNIKNIDILSGESYSTIKINNADLNIKINDEEIIQINQNNIILGYCNNNIFSNYNLIKGRFICSCYSENSFVLGGESHKLYSSCRSFINNGSFNVICCGNYSFINNGHCNYIYGRFSYINNGVYNCIYEDYSNINNGHCNYICGSYNIINNGYCNYILGCYNNTIGSGYFNFICGICYSIILSGCNNYLLPYANYNVILNGTYNCSCGFSSFIGVGHNNKILNSNNIILSGNSNVIFSCCSAIINGSNNYICDSSLIGIGISNTIFGICNSIINGSGNYIYGSYSFIVNGSGNNITNSSSFILTGDGNYLNSSNNGIINGSGNCSYGMYSLVIVGNENKNFGYYNLLIGNNICSLGNNNFIIRSLSCNDVFTTYLCNSVGIFNYCLIINNNNPPAGYDLIVGDATKGDVIAKTYDTYSSIRWKENIRPIQNPIEKISLLCGVYFNWKDTSSQDIGMIAEEVGKVIPEAVRYEADGCYAIALDYTKLVPLLIEAIKQLKQEIEKLKNNN